MPNLGAGVDPHYNLSPSGVQVYTPTPGVTATARFFNEGSQTAYIGGSGVTPANGLPILPSCKIELPNMTQSLFACSAYATTATNTTTSAVGNAGTASVASLTAAAGFVTGAWVAIGTGGNVEVVQISNGAGTTTLGFTAATNFVYDHKSGATVTVVTPSVAQLHVTPGVV